jgi:hypothetical protein
MGLKATNYVRAFPTSVTSTSYALSESRGTSTPTGYIPLTLSNDPEKDKFRGVDAWVIGTGADGATISVTVYLVFVVLNSAGAIESYHWRTYCSFDAALSDACPGLGSAAFGSPAAIKSSERIADVLSSLSVSAFATGLIASFQGVAPSVLSATDAEGVFTANDLGNAFGLAFDLKCGTATSANIVYRRNV